MTWNRLETQKKASMPMRMREKCGGGESCQMRQAHVTWDCPQPDQGGERG